MSPEQRGLERRVLAVRSDLERRTLVAACFWLGALVGVVFALAWLIAGPDGWRQGSDVPLILDVVLLGTLVGGFFLARAGARRWFSEAPLASAIEGAAGLDEGMVRGSLELSREVPIGVSHALVSRAAAGVLGRLGAPASELSGSLGSRVGTWRRRGLGFLSAVSVVLVLLAVSSPTRSGRAWAGLSSPLSLMADPALPAVSVAPGTIEVMRGTDVALVVQAAGRSTVQLVWQSAGDITRTEVLEVRTGQATRTFEAVSATIEYRVRTPDGVETESFRIVPVDPLFVSDMRVEVAYPPHTGFPPEEYRGTVPPLRLPVGTRLIVEGRSSRPLSDVVLQGADGEDVFRPSVDGTYFEGTWRPTASGTYAWTFLDDDAQPAAAQPEPLELRLLPDSVPVVTIPIPGRDTILPLTLRQPLILEAHDDYGLRRLDLVAYRVTAFGEAQEPVVQGLDLGGTRAALARPLLDFSDWGLLPGDQVRYYARAVDNAPNAQEAVTREYVLRMPQAAELRREAEQQLDETADRLSELAEEAAERAQETRDLQREAEGQREEPNASESSEMGFEEREELRRAIESQQEMTGQVDSLRAELEALEETMREAGQADPELREDLQELQELLEQIAGEQLQERLEEMAESLEGEEARRAEQSLEDLAREQENFRDRLEESLERFKRAAVEQDFRATESEAEELARQEEALADAFHEGDDPQQRAKQQQELEQRAEELDSRMERLQQRLEELGENDAAGEVQEARQQAQQSRQEMEQARQQAQQDRSQDAGEQAEQAAESMEQAAEQLEQAQQQMAQQQAERAQEAMRQASDDALSLARRQSELRREMQGASQDRVDQLRGDEASLLQGVRNVARNLQEATEGATDGNQELSAQMGRAMESLQRTIEAMEERRGPSQSPAAAAEQAVSDLNQLALMAMASAEQMGQQAQGQGGGEEVSEQLEQLAQQQGEVFNQTGQLTPLQLGEQAMREQLQRLAEEQEAVADDLGELSEQEGAEEESLGDLGELAREAQALAEQLAQGRLTPDMIQRQERLFHRLLDAGRSLEQEEEESEEREAERPGVFDRADVVPLGAEQLGAVRYPLPTAEQLRSLSPAVRQLVIQYFERLNRGGAQAAPPVGNR